MAVNLAVLLGPALAVELAFGEWIGAHPLGRRAIPRDATVTISAAPLYPGGDESIYRRDAVGFRGSGIDPAASASYPSAAARRTSFTCRTRRHGRQSRSDPCAGRS